MRALTGMRLGESRQQADESDDAEMLHETGAYRIERRGRWSLPLI
jgi:hypothetical protein